MKQITIILVAISAVSQALAAEPCSRLSGNETIGTQCISSKNFVFTKVEGPEKFGAAWKDPSGQIWSSYQGDFSNNRATEVCAEIGGFLPTADQYRKLVSNFDLNQQQTLTKKGMKELFALFPDMDYHWFWTSSIHPRFSDIAFEFDSSYGEIFDNSGDYLKNEHSVRCIAQAKEHPSVENVSLNRPDTCGTNPETQEGCIVSINVAFEAQSTGTCDIFSAEIDKGSGKAVLYIEKTEVEHCTRPVTRPKIKAFDVETQARLVPGEPIYLGNPIQ